MELPDPTKMRQRRFGVPPVPAGEQGDCWSTSVACYAGLDERARNELQRRIVLSDKALRRVGKDPEEESGWWNVTQKFLRDRGLPVLTVVAERNVLEECLYIASGLSPRMTGFFHATISYGNGELWNDPHPSDDGVIEVTEWICWSSGKDVI